MPIIALTGGIGTGKSTVSNLFHQLGIDIIDTDLIARDLVQINQPAYLEIKKYFGETILEDNHSINRQKLKTIIFKNKNHKLWLENLLHPLIRTQAIEQAQHSQSPYCILVIPLLTESQFTWPIDRILLVTCDKKIQIERLQKRDNLAEAAIKNIISQQADNQSRLEIAQDIINNNGQLKNLQQQVNTLHNQYLANFINH